MRMRQRTCDMRIVHVTPLYFPSIGGGELHLQKLSEGLASRGHQVTVLTANVSNIWELANAIDGRLPDEEVIGAVKVRRFRPDGGVVGSVLESWHKHVRGSYRALSLLLGKNGVELFIEKPLLVQVVAQVLATRVDIVASAIWYWPLAYHTYLARKLKRFILVGIPFFHTAEPWWCNRPIYKRMLANCDAVVVNTAHEASFVREQAAGRVEVVGVGIEPSAFEQRDGSRIRARYGLGNHPVVGFVGRSAPNKGALLLLQAMKTVWQWNREVRLVLAGPRAGRVKEVESFVEGLTEFERNRIVVIDDFPEKDKASIYDSFDVFVLPSIGESFGIAYLEAWMCCKPVIGARIGPTQCVIDEGIDGLLVDPADPQDTTQSIIELLSDSEERDRMGRSGHAKTIAQFTWDKVTDKVEKLYLELLAAKRASRFRAGKEH
jgi:glycosyltransferase involved in cell wall biosynthesis